jgi:anti-anti-sigma factor
MLRIHVEEQPQTTILHVEGKLAGNHVDELRRVWTAVRTESPGKQTVIDLGSVRFVDSVGKELLSQMYGIGTQLSGSGLCISALIGEITGVRTAADL